MSFDLANSIIPAWRDVDLAGGVVATFRPWTGLLASAAESAVSTACAAYLLGASSPEAWGVEGVDPADPVMFAAVWSLAEAAIRASYRIESLNVVMDDGQPFPPNRYMLARLFHRGVDGDGAAHLNAFLEAERAH